MEETGTIPDRRDGRSLFSIWAKVIYSCNSTTTDDAFHVC